MQVTELYLILIDSDFKNETLDLNLDPLFSINEAQGEEEPKK